MDSSSISSPISTVLPVIKQEREDTTYCVATPSSERLINATNFAIQNLQLQLEDVSQAIKNIEKSYHEPTTSKLQTPHSIIYHKNNITTGVVGRTAITKNIKKHLNAARRNKVLRTKLLKDLRSCLNNKSNDEFAKLLFHSMQIGVQNTCHICRKTFKNLYENACHITVEHDIQLECFEPSQSGTTQTTLPSSHKSHSSTTSKDQFHAKENLKKLLAECDRSTNRKKRLRLRDKMRKEFPQLLKKYDEKMIEKKFSFNDVEQIYYCIMCPKSYRQKASFTSHLFVDHNINWDYDVKEFDKCMNKIKRMVTIGTKKDAGKTSPINATMHTELVNKTQLPKMMVECTHEIQPDVIANAQMKDHSDEKKLIIMAAYIAKFLPSRELKSLNSLHEKLGVNSHILQELILYQANNQRHKYTQFIVKYMYPFFIKKLVEDIDRSLFSIFIKKHKSKDAKEYVSLIIKYNSISKNKIIISFYRLIQIQSNDVAYKIINILHNDGLKIQSCIGLGIANVTGGDEVISSICKEMKKLNPELIILPCIRKTLMCIARKACQCFPNDLSFMIKETYHFFENSKFKFQNTLHKELCKKIIRANREHHRKLCDIEWLLDLNGMKVIVDHWKNIKDLFFNIKGSYIGSLLKDMYSDTNLKYINFIMNVLGSIMKLHCDFSSRSSDPAEIFEKVGQVKKKLKNDMSADTSNIYKSNTLQRFLKCMHSKLSELIPKNETDENILYTLLRFSPKYNDLEKVYIFKNFIGTVGARKMISKWNALIEKNTLSKSGDDYLCALMNDDDCKYISLFALGHLCIPVSSYKVTRILSQIETDIDKVMNAFPIDSVEAIFHLRCQDGIINPEEFYLNMFDGSHKVPFNLSNGLK